MRIFLVILGLLFSLSANAQTVPNNVNGPLRQFGAITQGDTACWKGNNLIKDCGGASSGVTSINGTAGAFTFSGSGVSCTTTTCTFSGGSTTNFGTLATATNPRVTGDATTGFFSDTASTIEASIAGTKVLTWNATGEALTGALNVTSASATAFTVGPNGTTNSLLSVNAATTSAVSGLNITGAATGVGVTLQATDSGSNTSINIASKGTGNAILQSIGGTAALNSNNTIAFQYAGANRLSMISSGQELSWAPSAATSGAVTNFALTAASDINLSASTTAKIGSFNGSAATRQHATGALPLQNDFMFTGAIDSFVGASVLAYGATLSVQPKSVSTNATAAMETGLYIGSSGSVGGYPITGTVTSSTGLDVWASTGATNNYAALFETGSVGVGTGVPVAGSELTINGLIASQGGLPTCGAGCSSIASNSTNTRGSVTAGSLVTSVVVDWSTTLGSAPFCTISLNSGAGAITGYTTSTTILTISVASSTGDVITWHCYQ